MIIREKHQRLESLLDSYVRINSILDKWKINHPEYEADILITIGNEDSFELHTVEVICKKGS